MARKRVMAFCLPEVPYVPQHNGLLFFDPAIMISEEFDAATGNSRAPDLTRCEAQELHGIATEEPGFGIVVKAWCIANQFANEFLAKRKRIIRSQHHAIVSHDVSEKSKRYRVEHGGVNIKSARVFRWDVF